MGEYGEHAAMPAVGGSHESTPVKSDNYFSKLVCLTCGMGEFPGKMLCGAYVNCCCVREESGCGLTGPDGCLSASGGCDCYKPRDFDCSVGMKLLCLKVGVVNPMKEKNPILACF